MIRAVILVEVSFQDEEAVYAYHRMIEEGWHVDVATPSIRKWHGEIVKGLPNVVYGKFGVPLKVTVATEALYAINYDLVVIPGGFVSPDMLRMRPEVLAFVKAMHDAGKLVAAICHGPWVLISAGIFGHTQGIHAGMDSGIRATCYQSLKDDLINAGAVYVDNIPVVTHMNLITSDHYKHNGPFMKAVVEYMHAHEQFESPKRAP